jgi:hypothetical protein
LRCAITKPAVGVARNLGLSRSWTAPARPETPAAVNRPSGLTGQVPRPAARGRRLTSSMPQHSRTLRSSKSRLSAASMWPRSAAAPARTSVTNAAQSTGSRRSCPARLIPSAGRIGSRGDADGFGRERRLVGLADRVDWPDHGRAPSTEAGAVWSTVTGRQEVLRLPLGCGHRHRFSQTSMDHCTRCRTHRKRGRHLRAGR